MDEEIERLLVSVRADTRGFDRDVAAMRDSFEATLGGGAERTVHGIETALLRAVRSGKLGFEDLGKVALQVLAEIAASAIRSGIGAILNGDGAGGGQPGGGGLLAAIASLIGGGSPGRATGGPVSPMRPYWVGERGPELFVPTASGRIETGSGGGGGGGGARDVRVAITIQAGGTPAPAALQQSSRQLARAVRAALMEAE